MECDGWKISLDRYADLHGGGVTLGITVGEAQLARCEPVELDGCFGIAHGSQPSNEPGELVRCDRGTLCRVLRNNLFVVGVGADDALGDQQVIAASDGYLSLHCFFMIDPGDLCVSFEKIGVTENVAGVVGQDECLRWHDGGTASKASAIGGNDVASVIGSKVYSVKDMACGITGGTAGYLCQTLQRGTRNGGGDAECAWALRQFEGIKCGMHRGGGNATALDSEGDLARWLVITVDHGDIGSFVGTTSRIQR